MAEIKEGILETFQDYIREQLMSYSEFRSIFISPKKGNLESWIETSVAEKISLGIFVLPPIPQEVVPNVPGPVWSKLSIDIKVIENYLFNHSHRSAVYVAEKLSQILHGLDLNLEYWQGKLSLKERGAWDFLQKLGETDITLHFESFLSMEDFL